jgi:hypothetical protein
MNLKRIKILLASLLGLFILGCGETDSKKEAVATQDVLPFPTPPHGWDGSSYHAGVGA